MSWKNLFCNSSSGEEKSVPVERQYAHLMGLEENFDFLLTKGKVTNDSEFNEVCKKAKGLLTSNLQQRGMLSGNALYELDPALIALGISTRGAIGSMLLFVDDTEGNVKVRFHRLEDDLWDGYSKSYPEIGTTGRFKYEIFFPVLVE